MKIKWIIFFVLSLILVSCGSPQATPTEIQPTEPPPPPTETALPPEPSPTLEPIIFIDEFDGQLDGAWGWLNEDPQGWSLNENGWLTIQADNPGFFSQEGEIQQVNLLIQPAPEGSFILTTRLSADPNENFEQAGIFMIHDGVNYVSALNAFCEHCLPDTQGYGYFMDSYKNGANAAQGMVQGHSKENTTVFLRLVYDAEKGSVTGYAASQPDQWQELGTVEGLLPIQQIGLGAANGHQGEEAQDELVAHFAYFEVSRVETPVQTGDALPKPPEPTPTLEPTPLPETTPLPEGILFRDDFDGYLQPGWEWINENPERWSFVDFADSIWLKIVGENPGGLDVQSNTLMRPLPEGDFMITAHILADAKVNFQQANIFIFEDATNFIRLNLGFCEPCLPWSGYGYFMETIIDNNPFGDLYMISRDPETTDVYLRLINQGGSITGYYATEYGDWQKIGAFGNYFKFVSVGLGATNSVLEGVVVEDIEALFDYFEISIP